MRAAFLLLLLPLLAMADSGLQPFKSDGCSLFPDGTPTQPYLWCACCVAHDLAYWQGGTAGQRKQADLELQRCVKAAAGSDALASLMQTGVRAGGRPQLPSSFRWGYGWPDRSGYFQLTEEDRRQIEGRLSEHSYAAEMRMRCPLPAP